MQVGLRVVPSKYTEQDTSIDVLGCYSYSIYNAGTVAATLFETLPLAPGKSISYPNIHGWPYINNVQLEFEKAAGTKLLIVTKSVLIEHDKCGGK